MLSAQMVGRYSGDIREISSPLHALAQMVAEYPPLHLPYISPISPLTPMVSANTVGSAPPNPNPNPILTPTLTLTLPLPLPRPAARPRSTART